MLLTQLRVESSVANEHKRRNLLQCRCISQCVRLPGAVPPNRQSAGILTGHILHSPGGCSHLHHDFGFVDKLVL